MRIFLLFFLFLIFHGDIYSQIKSSSSKTKKLDLRKINRKNVSTPVPGEITQTSYPNLSIEIIDDKSKIFRNEFKSREKYILDGNEEIFFNVKITNISKTATAKNVKLESSYDSKSLEKKSSSINTNTIDFKRETNVVDIQPNQSETVEIKVSARENLEPSITTFNFQASEETGFGSSSEKEISIQTDVKKVPKLSFSVEITKTSELESLDTLTDLFIDPKDYFEIKIITKNTGDGPANDLRLNIKHDELLGFRSGSIDFKTSVIDYGNGKFESAPIKFITSQKIADYKEIPITVTPYLDGMRLPEETLYLPVRKEKKVGLSVSSVVREDMDDAYYVEENIHDITLVPKVSDNRNAYALIIGNEEYQHATNVSGALNDVNHVELYFERVLGIDESRRLKRTNVNVSNFSHIVEDLENIITNQGTKNNQLYVYYSGHGLLYQKKMDNGDIKTNSYFLPTDSRIRGKNLDRSLIPQNQFYSDLYGIESVTDIFTFIDACFSGENKDREGEYMSEEDRKDAEAGELGRGGGLLSENELSNVILEKVHRLSAVSPNQIAWSYNKFNKHNRFNLNHGVFTTFLLAAMQKNDKTTFLNADENEDNEITINELMTFINRNVSRITGNLQIPSSDSKEKNKTLINLNK